MKPDRTYSTYLFIVLEVLLIGTVCGNAAAGFAALAGVALSTVACTLFLLERSGWEASTFEANVAKGAHMLAGIRALFVVLATWLTYLLAPAAVAAKVAAILLCILLVAQAVRAIREAAKGGSTLRPPVAASVPAERAARQVH
ncbi:MAG: hypothetical protein INR63_06705 [Actinomycetospora chiangmaiensis]|nr:hypothetical protein [Actinomycetospora chiangmaiensis]